MNKSKLSQDDQQRLEQMSDEVQSMTLSVRELVKSLQKTFELIKQYDRSRADLKNNN